MAIITHNYYMNTYEKVNAVSTALIIPFIFGAVFITCAEFFNLIGNVISGEAQAIMFEFSKVFIKILPYVFCYCAAVALNRGRGSANAIWSVIALLLFSTAITCVSSYEASYIIGIIIALLFSTLSKHFSRGISVFSTLALSLILGLTLGYLLDYFSNLFVNIASVVSGKGVLSAIMFGALKPVTSLLGTEILDELFYYKSYGGTYAIDDDIITGIKDLFESGYKGRLLSTYLSGHYYLIFLAGGVGFSAFGCVKGSQKATLIAVTAAVILSGNLSLFILYVLLQCPYMLLPLVMSSALCYASAYVIDLGIGYLHGGGIIEMLIYGDKWVYLLAGGIVFVAIGYFVFRYCYEKYGITDSYNIYIPTRLNKTVTALGGINNIIRLNEKAVEVRNPKLVNTLAIDCEIRENLIYCNDLQVKELSEYIDSA